MAKTRYGVRFTVESAGDETAVRLFSLLECLRYAGLIQLEELEDRRLVTFRPPAGIARTREWALGSAMRLQTFGYRDATAVVV